MREEGRGSRGKREGKWRWKVGEVEEEERGSEGKEVREVGGRRKGKWRTKIGEVG